MVDPDEVVGLAQRLIRIPTPNPPGDTRAAAELLAAELPGWACELFEPSRLRRPACRAPLCRYGPTLLLNGHLDVVPVGEAPWTRDPWGGDLDGGRLYGRGATD